MPATSRRHLDAAAGLPSVIIVVVLVELIVSLACSFFLVLQVSDIIDAPLL